jgi:hypothetical protein
MEKKKKKVPTDGRFNGGDVGICWLRWYVRGRRTLVVG